jgi:hypothetical protein
VKHAVAPEDELMTVSTLSQHLRRHESKIHSLHRPHRLGGISKREERGEPEALFAFVSFIMALTIVAAWLISTLL